MSCQTVSSRIGNNNNRYLDINGVGQNSQFLAHGFQMTYNDVTSIELDLTQSYGSMVLSIRFNKL